MQNRGGWARTDTYGTCSGFRSKLRRAPAPVSHPMVHLRRRCGPASPCSHGHAHGRTNHQPRFPPNQSHPQTKTQTALLLQSPTSPEASPAGAAPTVVLPLPRPAQQPRRACLRLRHRLPPSLPSPVNRCNSSKGAVYPRRQRDRSAVSSLQIQRAPR